MIEINHLMKDKRVIWVIVPNKYSTYMESKNQIFASLVYEKKLGPDLFSDFIAAKKSILDLYQPNDTHLSGNGFKYLGKIINDFTEIRE